MRQNSSDPGRARRFSQASSLSPALLTSDHSVPELRHGKIRLLSVPSLYHSHHFSLSSPCFISFSLLDNLAANLSSLISSSEDLYRLNKSGQLLPVRQPLIQLKHSRLPAFCCTIPTNRVISHEFNMVTIPTTHIDGEDDINFLCFPSIS